MSRVAEKQQVRAACYCRISSDPNDKREGVTRQREDTADICAINGWTPVDYYVDNDRSASNGGPREHWERLLRDVGAGTIDAIVVWNQDRGWRKMADLESLRPVLEPRGVLLATTNIGVIDFRNADDVFRVQVSTAMSEMEVAKMKVRMRRAGLQRAERGTPKWKCAFGFTDDHQPHPVEAPMVRKAYETILGGGSLSGLAREWNAAGCHGRRWQKADPGVPGDVGRSVLSKPWSASTLSLFLRSPRNAGLRAYDGKVIGVGTWPPLVDADTWRAAQAVLDDPARKPGPKTCRRNLLTGLLRCGKCGGAMRGYLHPTAAPKYSCRECFGCSIVKAETDDLIKMIVCARLAQDDARELLVDRDAADVDRLSAEANTIRARMDEQAVEFADGVLTAQQLRAITERLRANLEAIESQMISASAAWVFADLPLGTDRVGAAFDRLDDDRQRAVIDALLTATVVPVGKRGRVVFQPQRVQISWKTA
ncbi:MAG: Recombinase [Frankiales bacterium]|nr:Recombinase [Frankiales bacterium]